MKAHRVKGAVSLRLPRVGSGSKEEAKSQAEQVVVTGFHFPQNFLSSCSMQIISSIPHEDTHVLLDEPILQKANFSHLWNPPILSL